LYIESDSIIDVRQQLRENTPYLVEHIQALDEAHLAYEQKSPDFHLTEFDK
ncbi:RNA polymerase epsilon subunit, partial [Aerococcus urinae]